MIMKSRMLVNWMPANVNNSHSSRRRDKGGAVNWGMGAFVVSELYRSGWIEQAKRHCSKSCRHRVEAAGFEPSNSPTHIPLYPAQPDILVFKKHAALFNPPICVAVHTELLMPELGIAGIHPCI
jgi:hypothetical protein